MMIAGTISKVGMSADANRSRQTLLRITEQTAQKLFADFGVNLRPAPEPPASERSPTLFGGVIEFLGKGIRGSLTLATSSEPLGNSNPLGPAPDRQWLAELMNQLMGRFKSQAILYGVEITSSTPVTLRSEHIQTLTERKGAAIFLKGTTGLIRVWLDVDFGRGFQMLDRADPALGGPDAGDIVLF
jgi:hypothetical protein